MKALPVVRGFTLVEAMVAVTIITFAVAGPLFSAGRAIVAAQIARDQLTASYLAQEGVEYIRAMRDNEYLAASQAGGAGVSTAAWTNFLTGGNAASVTQCRATTCTFDPAAPGGMGTGSGFSLRQCSLSGNPYPVCAPLYLANGIYTTQSGITGAVQTSFTRTVQVVDIPGTEDTPLYPDKRIVSTVSWSFHDRPYVVVVTEHLTPWQ